MKRKLSNSPSAIARRRMRKNETSWQRRFRLAKRYYGVARFRSLESARYLKHVQYWRKKIEALCEERGADIEACRRWRALCERRRRQYVEFERRSA